jgi:hypothetical protein
MRLRQSSNPASTCYPPSLLFRQARSLEAAIPSSWAIWLNGRPLLASSPTASRLNSIRELTTYPSNTFLPHQELIRGVHHFEGGSVRLAAALKSPVPTMVQALPTT